MTETNPNDESKLIRTRLKTAVRVCGAVPDAGYIRIEEEEGNGAQVTVDGTEASVRVKSGFGSNASNKDVFDAIVRKTVDTSTRGLDFYMLAYGSSGSGKTHSVFGTDKEKGVLRLFVDRLVKRHQLNDAKSDVKVGFSFFELKQYQVFDCLSDEKGPKLLRTRLHEQPINTVKEYAIHSTDDLEELLHIGTGRRAAFNAEFCESEPNSNVGACVTVRTTCTDNGKERYLISRNYFFDLTGSNADPSHMDKDLTALHSVVNKVVLRSPPNFRISALARFLEPCLSGRALTCVLGTLNPAEGHQKEGCDTLNFLWQLSKIWSVPEVHEECQVAEDVQYPKPYQHAKDETDAVASVDGMLSKLTMKAASGDTAANSQRKTAESAVFACMIKPPEPPCIVELFSDYSHCYWHPISKGSSVLKMLDTSNLLTVSKKNESVEIGALFGIVEVNSNTLTENDVMSVKHLDIIAMNGTRFFLPLLNNAFTPVDLEHRSVFNRYVRIISRKAKEELNAQLKAETAEDYRLFKEEMTQEMKTMIFDVEKLKEKLKSPPDPEDVENLTVQLTELQTEILNHQGVEKTVAESMASATRGDIFPIDDKVPAHDVVRVRGWVDNVNSTLERIGCQKICFGRNVFSTSGEVCVRAFDRENNLFANITIKTFKDLYANFYQLYRQNGSSPDLGPRFISELFALDVNWNKSNEAGMSTILADIVKDSVKETATRRASSIAELNSTFCKRKSVIARMSLGTRAMPEDEDEEFMDHWLRYMENEAPISDTTDTYEMLLEALAELQNQFSIFGICKTLKKENIQKRALVFYSVAKFQDQIAAVHQLMRYYTVMNEGLNLCMTLDIAFEQLGSMDRIFRTWVRTLTNTFVNCEDVVSSIRLTFENIIRDLGSYAFNVGVYLPEIPLECGQYDGFKEVFNEGVLLVAETLVKNLEDKPTKKDCKSLRVVKRVLAGCAVRELYKYIGTKSDFNTEFYVNVFVQAVGLYETTFGNYKEVVASKYALLLNRIKRSFASIVNSETIALLEKIINTLKKQEIALGSSLNTSNMSIPTVCNGNM